VALDTDYYIITREGPGDANCVPIHCRRKGGRGKGNISNWIHRLNSPFQERKNPYNPGSGARARERKEPQNYKGTSIRISSPA